MSNAAVLASNLIEQFSLAGRTAVITGAAGGIGRQAALTFAQAGAVVVASDLGGEGLEETCALVRSEGGVASAVVCDVADRAAVRSLAEQARSETGRLDVWANVAGIMRTAAMVDATPEDVEAITRVNQWGTYWGMAAAARTMGRGGSIINVSSAGAELPMPNLSMYAMTKAAVQHLTRCGATEFGPLGIRVNCVAPGFTETGMVRQMWTAPDGSEDDAARAEVLRIRALLSPMGATGVVEDQTLAMLYLASDASRFLTGQTIRPNGGSVMG